jgi:hypothetical protein
VNKAGRPVRREGAKWQPDRLATDTLFILGSRANKVSSSGHLEEKSPFWVHRCWSKPSAKERRKIKKHCMIQIKLDDMENFCINLFKILFILLKTSVKNQQSNGTVFTLYHPDANEV